MTDISTTAASNIWAYTGRGTRGIHHARTAGPTQVDSVEIEAGMGFGGEYRAQLWVILKGHGRFVHGEEGPAIAAGSGHMEYFAADERRLFVAESDATLLIIEADEFRFDGPWAEWQDPGRTVVRHQG
jgi:hypothetical protein